MSYLPGQSPSTDSNHSDDVTAAPAPAPPLAEIASVPPPPLPDIPARPPAAAASKSQAAPQPSSRPGISLPEPRSSALKSTIKPADAPEGEIPSWLSSSSLNSLDIASALVPQRTDISGKPEPAVNLLAEELAAIEETAIMAGMAAANTAEAELLAGRQRETPLMAEQLRGEQRAEPIAPSEPKLTGLRDVLFALGLNNPNRIRESTALPELPQVQPQHPTQKGVPSPAETSLPAVEHETPPETARVVIVPPELPLPPADSTRKDRRDRRDAYDEVEILPSWRGQYKRKD